MTQDWVWTAPTFFRLLVNPFLNTCFIISRWCKRFHNAFVFFWKSCPLCVLVVMLLMMMMKGERLAFTRPGTAGPLMEVLCRHGHFEWAEERKLGDMSA